MRPVTIYFSALLFLFCLNTGTIVRAQSVNIQDSLALVALYNSTNGQNWTNNDNWLEGAVETWWGIAVNDGRIYSIDLASNNLSGSIPAEIGQLDNLFYLLLYDNKLSGAIPEELGQLSNLHYFSLRDNQLSSTIPEELGQLTNLVTFYLWSNQLT